MNRDPDVPLRFANEVFRIQGAVFEVNREMGMGFLEAVYQECLTLEFAARDIPFIATPSLQISYKGSALRQSYMPDFICFEKIVVELKATRAALPEHRAQVINYLKATGLRLGLLVNFSPAEKASIERLAV